MHKYLYLTESDWANTWIYGGKVPLKLASEYRADERMGIYTPDENLVYHSTHDLSSLEPAIFVDQVKGLSIGKVIVDGQTVAEDLVASRYKEDGVILCLSNEKSSDIARKMKKAACVKILDTWKLKSHFDKQIGVVGEAKGCEYTEGYERDHFLKSKEDAWQSEFRIFWPIASPVEVVIPEGLAVMVDL